METRVPKVINIYINYVPTSNYPNFNTLKNRTWNTDCGSPQDAHFPNWREMFILRPRLQFHGCYISKTTYVRAGENSFQDANSYQPWHLINYYRYVRFFSDRSAVMLTTADTPLTVLGHLKRHNTSRLPSLLHGYYTLQGNVVTAIFKRKTQPTQVPHYRRRRKEDVNNNDNAVREHVFHLVSLRLYRDIM